MGGAGHWLSLCSTGSRSVRRWRSLKKGIPSGDGDREHSWGHMSTRRG